jgi:hypothetical protein
MPFSRELIAQLGQHGLSLLPLPRPPSGLLVAVHEGRRACEEVAFQAFASRALRRLRSETGDPRAEVAALESAAIGVRLSSPFGHHRVEGGPLQIDARRPQHHHHRGMDDRVRKRARHVRILLRKSQMLNAIPVGIATRIPS